MCVCVWKAKTHLNWNIFLFFKIIISIASLRLYKFYTCFSNLHIQTGGAPGAIFHFLRSYIALLNNNLELYQKYKNPAQTVSTVMLKMLTWIFNIKKGIISCRRVTINFRIICARQQQMVLQGSEPKFQFVALNLDEFFDNVVFDLEFSTRG